MLRRYALLDFCILIHHHQQTIYPSLSAISAAYTADGAALADATAADMMAFFAYALCEHSASRTLIGPAYHAEKFFLAQSAAVVLSEPANRYCMGVPAGSTSRIGSIR